MLPLNMAVQNGEGETWLGEAAERLQEEITRLELESMNARQDARKAVEEKKQMEELTRSMMTPVQRMFYLFNKVNETIRLGLKQSNNNYRGCSTCFSCIR